MYEVLGRDFSYFVKHGSKSSYKYPEEDVFKMLELYIDNIFVQGGGYVFQKTVDIPMGTNCAPLLAAQFIHSFEADFIVDLIQRKEHRLARSFYLSFRYIGDVLSSNNSSFGGFIHRVYPPKNLS